MRNALDDIALLMASFFAENDFVASDVAAGLLLLVHSPYMPIPAIQDYELKESSQLSWMQFPECLPIACRMFDIAVAIYGWPTYLFNNFGCVSCLKLCKRSNFKK